MSLLRIHNLQTFFRTPRGTARAVDGVSLQVDEGEVVGIVGESGCGKSVLALSILRLLPRPPAFFAGGEILFMGKDLLASSPEEIMRIRGNRISMIFQEPMSALNPVFTVGNQLMEVFRVHRSLGRAEARESAVEMLAKVGVPAPERRVREYPYQLSGGCASGSRSPWRSPAGRRSLADEPTTALDVTSRPRSSTHDRFERRAQHRHPSHLPTTGVVAESPGAWPSCIRARSWRRHRRSISSTLRCTLTPAGC
jgi:ABC-type dipeptide/oligopeptide/nickel transport system ATPase component